ncbi:MAG: PD-(D/E)XK nuclease family protein, partial [Bacteroidales bacterium]|nr:PD-(D/E)XK nuclease family protein [Bacteroidales bacterium]
DDTIKQKYHTTKSYEIRPSQTPPIEIEKNDHIKKIQDLLGYSEETTTEDIQIKKGVFPKLINTYLKCPVSFYFEYIEEIKEEESIDDDTSALDFGNLLHESCHFLYHTYIGKNIEKEDFASIKSNIENAINFAVCKVFNVKETDKAQFDEAKSNIMIKPLRKYVNKIVASDEDYAPFQIVDLENEKIHDGDKKRNYTIKYKIKDTTNETILLKGIIDRIDLKEGKLRVIDYKTSSIKNDKKTYDEKFWIPETFKNKEAAQVLIYSEIMSQLKAEQNYTIQPYIISVTNINDGALKFNNNGNIRTKKNIENYNDQDIFVKEITDDGGEEIKTVKLRLDVNNNLKGILNELLDPQKKFTQTPNTDNCEYCPYNKICNRNN